MHHFRTKSEGVVASVHHSQILSDSESEAPYSTAPSRLVTQYTTQRGNRTLSASPPLYRSCRWDLISIRWSKTCPSAHGDGMEVPGTILTSHPQFCLPALRQGNSNSLHLVPIVGSTYGHNADCNRFWRTAAMFLNEQLISEWLMRVYGMYGQHVWPLAVSL